MNSSLFAGEESANHIYLTVNLRQAAFNYVLAKQHFRKSYVGGVFLVKESGTNELTTEAIACEVTDLTGTAIEPPISARQCGAGTTRIEP